MRAHPADEPVLRRQPELPVATRDGVPLERHRGGDHVLGLVGGDGKPDRVPLTANHIALRTQPHLGLDLGPRWWLGGGGVETEQNG